MAGALASVGEQGAPTGSVKRTIARAEIHNHEWLIERRGFRSSAAARAAPPE
jgi:hypothetical protein